MMRPFFAVLVVATLACERPDPVQDTQSELTCAPATTGMILWLRAGDLALADAAAVATWTDVSAQSNTAAQSAAARRPIFAASSIGGLPAVRFDGTDDRLDLALNTFAPGNFPLSVIAVLSTSDTDAHIAGTGSSSAGYLSSYGGALTLVGGSAVIKANTNSSGLHLQTTTAIAGAPHIVTAIAQTGSSAIYIDGQPAGVSNAATNAYPYTKSTLGSSDGSQSNASRDPFAGDLAELIVYQRALSSAERTELENCLGEKYAVDILGCDGVPNSGLIRDACGVCGGDGSSCAAVTGDQLALWLRADDLTLATGTGIAFWTDASSNHNHAAQNTAARRPTLTTNAIAGHAAVSFDGTDDRLDLTSNTFAPGNFPLTVFAVLSTSDDQGHIAGTGSSSPGYLTTYGGALTLVGGAPVIKANSGGAGLHLTASSAIADNTPRIVSSVARTGMNTVFVDCAVAGISGAATGAYAYGKSTIGASDGSQSNAVIDPFSGSLAELIVYRRALDDPERVAIEDYLVAKYGLATCNHILPDPAITLAGSAAMFFKMSESGTIPRADVAGGLDVYPFPPDAAGIFAEPGIVGSAQNVNGPGGYHYYRSSAAAMNHGGGSFTWAGWMKIASFYSDQTFVGKWNHDTNNRREYKILFNLLTSKFEFEVSGTGAAGPGHSARVVHPAAISLNTYYFIEAWHDAAGDTVNLRIGTTGSRGSVASVPWSGGAHFDSADLNIGAHNTCADAHLHGSIDAVGYWKRLLSPDESLRLWNNGAGFEP